MPLQKREYVDLNLSFDAHPVTGAVSKLTGTDAVKRSIRNLILTGNYEKQFQPDLGSGIALLLFEPINTLTQQKIKTAIEDAINLYEPRAKLLSVDVIIAPDYNGYTASILFEVVDQEEPVSINVFLERVR